MDGCYVRVAESKNCALTQVEAATHCTAMGASMWWNNWLADTQVITCPDRPLPPPAQGTGKICNQTSKVIDYATMVNVNGGWLVSGWWQIQPANCVNVTLAGATFVTAQNPQGTWGDLDSSQCVNPTLKFSHAAGICPAGEVQRGFKNLKANETWNLGGL